MVGLLAASCTSGDDDDPVGGAAEPVDEDAVAPTTARRVALGVSSPFDEERTLEERIVELEKEVLGRRFGAIRLYHRWDEPFPAPTETFLEDRDTVVLLSVSTQRLDGSWVPWEDIATAPAGSPLAGEIDAWADALEGWGGPVVVTLDHEPDFYRNGGDGTAADYVDAYQAFAESVRAYDPEVLLGWIGVAFFFDDDSETQAPDFFPGADVVDVVGADGFNWYVCRDDPGTWRSFDDIFEDFLDWAADEVPDTPLLLAEVGTVEDLDDPDRKSAWLRDAAGSMTGDEWEDLRYVAFWDNLHETDAACDFRLSSSPRSAEAFQAIAARQLFART